MASWFHIYTISSDLQFHSLDSQLYSVIMLFLLTDIYKYIQCYTGSRQQKFNSQKVTSHTHYLWVMCGSLAQLVATLVRSRKLLYAGPG